MEGTCGAEMSEAAAEKKENIPDESAGKRIPNGGNAAKSREVRDEQIPAFRASEEAFYGHMTAVNFSWTPAPSAS